MDQPPAEASPGSPDPDMLPEAAVQRWVRPFVRFMRIEAASGVVLLCSAAVALVAANSPLAHLYHSALEFPLTVSFGALRLDWTLHHWINDGLMTVFFFVVGLEIKREFVVGELRDPRKAALPIAAALGGMVAPAAIYLALQFGQPGERGWGIPMATDIAFVVGCMALLAPRIPHGLRIMLLALAIVDDIGAILVIAVGYSSGVQPAGLAFACVGFGLCALLNRIGVRQVGVYFAVGAGIWLAFVQSGVHPAIAGVLLGLLTPARAWIEERRFLGMLSSLAEHLKDTGPLEEVPRRAAARNVEAFARETVPPLERLELSLHPWTAFLIMPLFAFANAGVTIHLGELGHPVENAVMAALVLGKPIGIVLFSWLFVRAGLARLPTGVNWRSMLGAGCLAGIGFTLSLFVAGLALDGELLNAAKIGVLTGSTLSAVLGALLLIAALPREAPAESDLDTGVQAKEPA